MLFCDLVGFTPLSERRDPEEVRDLLSGYFELARAIVGRYGGIVEKFIGDAVMEVWGAPVAKEDDAERAVRAGLELVSAVAAYGSEHQTDLQARVGILTGGAATTETPAEGLGLALGPRQCVVGDGSDERLGKGVLATLWRELVCSDCQHFFANERAQQLVEIRRVDVGDRLDILAGKTCSEDRALLHEPALVGLEGVETRGDECS